MKNITFLGTCILILALSFAKNDLFAQSQAEELSLNKSVLPKQIDYIIKKSNDYEDFKMVKVSWLYALRAHVVDSVKALDAEIVEAKSLARLKVQQYDSIKAELAVVNQKLTTVVSEKDSMKFLGLQMSKAAYSSMVWIIIAILITALLFFILMYKRGIAITHQAKVSLEETKLEFENHRKKTLERIEKLGVEHLNEMNKLKSKYQSNFPNSK